MKKILFFLIFLSACLASHAQNPVISNASNIGDPKQGGTAVKTPATARAT